MAYIEQWPLRFVAFHRSDTMPEITVETSLDETIESMSEGNSVVQEMMETATGRYGANVVYIELQ
jgi:hypothetical protein